MDFEPIPYFYDSIDRNAIIVRPKEPFYDWLNSVFPEDKPTVISNFACTIFGKIECTEIGNMQCT